MSQTKSRLRMWTQIQKLRDFGSNVPNDTHEITFRTVDDDDPDRVLGVLVADVLLGLHSHMTSLWKPLFSAFARYPLETIHI